MIYKNYFSAIEGAGFRSKTFKVEHLAEISMEFSNLVEKGMLDEDFYKQNLTGFNYNYSEVLKNVKTVMLIAAPQNKSYIEFNINGKVLTAVSPPIYKYPMINRQITQILNDRIVSNGYSFARATLPLKLLAVRSGLGQYGRNNICYIPGIGSYMRLAAFVTDLSFPEDSWGEMKVMDSCSSCKICVEKCPTKSINENRFVIHAESCITNFNEYETPIPEWIMPEWHNSIIGCMKCQEACPQNKNTAHLVDGSICFGAEETEWILEGKALDSLPEETRIKIFNAGMEGYYHVLPRNIQLLI